MKNKNIEINDYSSDYLTRLICGYIEAYDKYIMSLTAIHKYGTNDVNITRCYLESLYDVMTDKIVTTYIDKYSLATHKKMYKRFKQKFIRLSSDQIKYIEYVVDNRNKHKYDNLELIEEYLDNGSRTKAYQLLKSLLSKLHNTILNFITL